MQTKKEFEEWWEALQMDKVLPTKSSFKDFMFLSYDRGAGDYMDYVFRTCHVLPIGEAKTNGL